MGSHKTSALTGKGSSTPEVSFKIALTGCPGFPGYYGSNSASMSPTSSENGVISTGTSMPNTISFRIDPVTAPIDANNGVLSLAKGAGMATGVGLQILWINGQPLQLSQEISIGADSLLTANINWVSISYKARYLQTADTVKAGMANAVATYTILYK